MLYACPQNFFKRSKKQITLHGIDGSHLDREKKVCKFFESKVLFWIELLHDIVKAGKHSSNQVSEKEAAILRGSICCYHNIKDVPQDSLSMLNKLICNLDRSLEVEEENISGLAKTTWKSLFGAALSSYHKLLLVSISTSSELGLFLSLAKRHSTCPHVVEYMDSLHGKAASLGITGEFDPQNLLDLLRIFGFNLSSPNKHARVLTLRILSYFMKMDQCLGSDEEQPHKRQRTEDSREETVDAKYTNWSALLPKISIQKTTPPNEHRIIVTSHRLVKPTETACNILCDLQAQQCLLYVICIICLQAKTYAVVANRMPTFVNRM